MQKMLVTSIFFFSHNVFKQKKKKRKKFQRCLKLRLCGKVLNNIIPKFKDPDRTDFRKHRAVGKGENTGYD